MIDSKNIHLSHSIICSPSPTYFTDLCSVPYLIIIVLHEIIITST